MPLSEPRNGESSGVSRLLQEQHMSCEELLTQTLIPSQEAFELGHWIFMIDMG